MLHSLWHTRKRSLVLLMVLLALALWAAVVTRQAAIGRTQRHIDAGIEYVRTGRPIDAEREWREASKLTPNNPALWELLSELYINTQQWSKGTEALQQLLRTDPKRPYLYSRLAACALRSGNEVEARSLALEELKRNPNDEASLTILAFLSGMQENFEQQIGYLQRLLALEPNNPETLHDLTQAYMEAGKYADVLKIVERLLVVNPKDGNAYVMRGTARFETDGSSAASAQTEADLLKALQVNPLSALARYMLGRVYLRQGRFQNAIFQLETAQKLNPRRMDVPFELGNAYAHIGQMAKAIAARKRFDVLRQETTQVSVLQKQCALEKDNFAAHLQLGQIMLERGDYRQARNYLQKALVLRPTSSAAREASQKLAAQLGEDAPPAPR